MDDIEIVVDCRYGKKCRRIGEDGKIHMCNAYVKVDATDDLTGENIVTYECADTLIPRLLVESIKAGRGSIKAICSLREDTNKRQDATIMAVLQLTGVHDAKLIDNK